MYARTLIASLLTSSCLATPLAHKQYTIDNFRMITTHPGHYYVHAGEVVANGHRFWLGKDTKAFCPVNEDLNCADMNSTTTQRFIITSVAAFTDDGNEPNEEDSIAMNTRVPFSQFIYVAADGQLGYLPGLEELEEFPEGSVEDQFLYTPPPPNLPRLGNTGTLLFNNQHFFACPTSPATPSVYQIYAAGIPGFLRTDCTGAGILTVPSYGAPVWRYY